jgi:hypothetical protein
MKKEDVVVHLINKMLEKHGVDFDFVSANPKIEGEDWYQHFTCTSEEQAAFKEYAVEYIRKRWRMSKKFAEKEANMFILAFGLQVQD